jgi:hypothetical protein
VEIFRGSPHLHGALCVNRFEIFDRRKHHREAAALCRACPPFELCRQYSRGRKRLSGTWAGQFRTFYAGGDDEEQS